MSHHVDPATAGSARVADLEDALGKAFPREWAEEWDRVGLLAGDRDREISGVFVTLDPTRSSVRRAVAVGANVVLTHHPAALSIPERLAPGRGSAGTLFAALEAGVALIAEHTNLDRAPEGVSALPAKLGLVPLGPVERREQPMVRVTTYAPPELAESIVGAMASAGAGRIGAYERCAFSSAGQGEFTPLDGTRPYSGEPGRATRAGEVRVEMVCSSGIVSAVVSAALSAHPYEEPLIVAEQVTIARGSARMGMLCETGENATLADLATLAANMFGIRPRIWGDPSMPVRRCVTATGSASALIADAMAAGADALVCGEVRYHDALDARESGLAVIEAGHDVTEWPLVEVLGRVTRAVPGLPADRVTIDTPTAGWWTP